MVKINLEYLNLSKIIEKNRHCINFLNKFENITQSVVTDPERQCFLKGVGGGCH